MSKTIVALDFSSKEEVVDFLSQFDEPIYVKVGMELTYACGLDIIKTIKDMGHHIFLDLKLHDIPNTVKGGMKTLRKELNIPCIIIDVPFNHTMPVSRHNKEYIADQYRAAIKQLEDITGRAFDYDKFFKVQEQVQRSVYWWNKVATYAQRKPSPLNGFDLFNYMALIVACRSLDYAEITFKAFADELEKNLKAGVYAFKGAEKTRFQWEGIAVWPHLGHTFKTMRTWAPS